MRPAAPSFLAWLAGRLAHPPRADRCAHCGRGEVDARVTDALREAGHEPAAALTILCAACRGAELRRWLGGAMARGQTRAGVPRDWNREGG